MIEPGAIKTNWGPIAAQHLRDSSAGTAYEEAGARWANSMEWFYQSRWLSSPDIIAKAISRAVNSHHPKARYCRGRFSVSGRVAHALLPARWWDALMRRMGRVKI
jgi:hypothetical protein